MISMVWNLCTVHADAPVKWQMLFQDPATSNMEGITDLHHDIVFFLLVILVLVLWLGARIVQSFHHTLQPVPERFNHHTSLELIWAILPSVIVTLIALPSLTLVYTFDDLVAQPRLTVKVTGAQWYWKYAMKESVHLNLSRTAENILLEASRERFSLLGKNCIEKSFYFNNSSTWIKFGDALPKR